MHHRTTVAAALLAVALLAACSSGGGPELTRDTGPTTTAGTVAPPVPEATTTTAPPPEATTTAPPAPTTTAPQASIVPRVLVSERGVVVPVLERVEEGFRVSTPCGKSTVLRQGTPVEGAVVLDAGHGGGEPGAVGPGGLAEREVNLAVVNHARDVLQANGVQVVLTRTANYRMTLAARAEVVKALAPRAFVSVHHNAEPDGPRAGPGTETFYQVASPESKRLAGLVYEEVVKALSRYQVAWVADTDAGAKYRRSGSGDDYYGILRRTQGTPAALAELAFVSNPAEEALLARADVQQVEGEAVARGILRFLTTRDPGSGFTEPYPRETPAGPGGGAAGCEDPPL